MWAAFLRGKERKGGRILNGCVISRRGCNLWGGAQDE